MIEVFNGLMDNFLLYVGLTMALVGFIKEMFSLEGKAVQVASFFVGILMAGLVYVGQTFAWGEYVEAGFFILAVGLFASGFFDLGVDIRNGG